MIASIFFIVFYSVIALRLSEPIHAATWALFTIGTRAVSNDDATRKNCRARHYKVPVLQRVFAK
jgi:hypothetical protein